MTAQTAAATAAAQAAGETATTEDDHGYFPRTVITHADGTESRIFAPDTGSAVEADLDEGWLVDHFAPEEEHLSTAWLDPATDPAEVVAQAVAAATGA